MCAVGALRASREAAERATGEGAGGRGRVGGRLCGRPMTTGHAFRQMVHSGSRSHVFSAPSGKLLRDSRAEAGCTGPQ
jgi:hypothetical protein